MTRKITMGLAKILAGKRQKLYLGNLEAKRDWSYAPEYIEAMWLMLQQDEPGDYVVGTGEAHSVREFLDEAFSYVDLNWRDYVEIDPRYFRPTEVEFLVADASKARKELAWGPRVTLPELVRIMVDGDIEAVGLKAIGEGKKILAENFAAWHR